MPERPSAILRAGLAALALGLAWTAPAKADDLALPKGWELSKREVGVAVYRQKDPARDLPRFRGVTLVPFPLAEVLAVVDDVAGHPHWMNRCNGARLVEQTEPDSRIVYNRTKGMWLINDRDAVIRVRYRSENQGQRVRVEMRAADPSLVAEVEDVVRMTELDGEFLLERIDDGRTRVEYEMNSDPGGNISPRIAQLFGEDLPFGTLRDLNRRLQSTQGRYTEFTSRWESRLGAGAR